MKTLPRTQREGQAPEVPEVLSPQDEIDSCAALLYLEDLVSRRQVRITGSIDKDKTGERLGALEQRGFVVDDERACKLAMELGVLMGAKALHG